MQQRQQRRPSRPGQLGHRFRWCCRYCGIVFITVVCLMFFFIYIFVPHILCVGGLIFRWHTHRNTHTAVQLSSLLSPLPSYLSPLSSLLSPLSSVLSPLSYLLWGTAVVFDWSLVGHDSALRLPFGSSLAHSCASLGALLWGTAVLFDWSLVGQDSALRLPFWFEFGA